MRCSSFEFLTNYATKLASLRRGQVTLLGFRVGVHHVEGLIAWCPVVEGPQPPALASTGGRPPDFAQTSGPLNDRPLLRAQHQRDLQLAILFVVEMPPNRGREHGRFDEPHRPLVYAIGVSSFNQDRIVVVPA